ncbi:hypothetical protein BH23CHL6_BH23CHL6_01560 [soil metagenome]
MFARDRLANVVLLASGAVAWAAVGYVLFSLDPIGDAGALLAGALLLGGAVALSLMPLLWLAGFARTRRIAYRGDWWRAVRRGGLVGLVVAIFVVLRGQDLLTTPLALFVLAMAAFVELTLSLRR